MNRAELYEHIKQVRLGRTGTPLGTPHSGYEYKGYPVHDWRPEGYTFWSNPASGAAERYQGWLCLCSDDCSGKRGHEVWIRSDGRP